MAQVVVDVERGRLSSLVLGGHQLLTATTMPDAPAVVRDGCFVMAPYAGRVRDARFTFAGRSHRLPVLLPPHAAHGLVLDRPWAADGPGAWVVELDDRWPFGGTVRLTVAELGESVQLGLEVANEQRAMPASAGLHPWFPRHLAGATGRVLLEADRQYVRDDTGIPTGETVPPRPGPWDDCFTGVRQPVTVEWPGVGRLEVTADHDHWVVFDERPETVCVEPQTAPPDALNLPEVTVVEPGHPLRLTTRLSWTAAG